MNSSDTAARSGVTFHQEARTLAIVIALVIVGMIAVFWVIYGFSIRITPLLLVALVYFIRVLFPSVYSRVVVSADGIDFRGAGYRIHTTWDNLDGMNYVRFGIVEGDVLLLREPTVEVNRWVAYLSKEVRWLEQNPEFAPLGKVIPLFLLHPKWRTGKLGQEIQRHAPHLFVEYGK
jgi:hypothetical protein